MNIISASEYIWTLLQVHFKNIWKILDEGRIIRRAVLFLTLYLTYLSINWSINFASSADKTASDIGLIIAAVNGPVAVLQGFVTKFYFEARSD